MPRKPRRISPSGYYHVILRGINKLSVFDSYREKSYFLKVLKRMGKEREYWVFAYCLMNNHVHLLLRTGAMPLAESMKRICVSFVYYYNKLHNRSGSLFGNRYNSVVIENDLQLMLCAKYIHNNPVKAGIVRFPEEHPWSSFRYYMDPDLECPIPLNTRTLLNLYDLDTQKAVTNMREFTNQEIVENLGPTTLKDYVEEIIFQEHVLPEELNTLSRQRRDSIIRKIIEQTGAKAKDLSEILGLSTTIIYKAKQGDVQS
jgi:REP element-mobilizing transposase RayT